MKAHCKNTLPQEGTGCSAAGESLTEPSSVSPSYSGGGNNRHQPSVDAESQGGSRPRDVESLGVSNTSASQGPKQRTQSVAEALPVSEGRVTRSRFKRPATPVHMMVSDSGDSDCSQMSLASKASSRSKRTRKAAETKQAASRESGLFVSDGSIVERLERENADLRSQLASLTATVAQMAEQLSLIGKGQMGPSVDRSIAVTGLAPEAEAQLRRSIAIEIGGMMDAKLAAIVSRLPPEKPLRPPLASDAKRAVALLPVAQDPSVIPNSNRKNGKGKKKGKNGKQKSVAPVVELPAVPAATAQVLQPASTVEAEAWSTVAKKAKIPQSNVTAGAPAALSASSTPAKGKKQPVKLPRVPASAAITITVSEGSSATLAEVLSVARQQIRLADLSIDTVGQKRAADGGMVLSIFGADCSTKADSLASRMREVLAEYDVHIARPMKMAEARIMDLDDAVTPADVAIAIAEAGGCSSGDVKVGEIRRPPNSLGHAWVRGPLAAVKKLASNKRMRIGWTSVRVEVLEARRMMCFRCLEPGHVRRRCTSVVDRSTQCYSCGGPHKARECTSPTVRCPLCADQGRPADHRLGGKKCAPRKKWASLVPATLQRSSPAPLGAGLLEEMDTSSSQP